MFYHLGPSGYININKKNKTDDLQNKNMAGRSLRGRAFLNVEFMCVCSKRRFRKIFLFLVSNQKLLITSRVGWFMVKTTALPG